MATPSDSPVIGGTLGGVGAVPGTLVQDLVDALAQTGVTITTAQAKKALIAAQKKQGGTWNDAASAVYQGLTGGNAPATPTTGGGSSSTSGGSSSSGSSAAGPSPQAIANAEASYFNLLSSYGIPQTPDIQRFVNQAVTQGLNSAEFMIELRKTRAYAQAFPGIMRGDGTMRMTEAQFLSGYQQARDFASSVGRSLNIQAYGLAVKNNNSPSEIKAKIQALDILRTNADVLNQFSDYLVTAGVVPKPLSQGDLLAFVMKQGPKQWENEWQMAYAGSQIEAAGINVGKPSAGNDIGYQALQVLIRNAGPGVDITKVDYGQLAQLVQTALPVSEIYQGGITKKNLVSLTLGGPKAEPIARRVQALVSTYAARFDPQAIPQLTQGGMITGSPQSVQTTE